jgi:hypothetical protein
MPLGREVFGAQVSKKGRGLFSSRRSDQRDHVALGSVVALDARLGRRQARGSRKEPPALVIFFAAAVMNVRRPECEEAPSTPISRNRVRNQTATALALYPSARSL